MKFSDLDLLSIGNTVQMTGVLYSGEGRTLLCFFPGEKEDLPLEVLEMAPEEWQDFLKQTDVLNTEALARSKDGTIGKAILRKSQRQIDASVSWRVFKRDGYRCRYCGNDNTPLTVDHLVLWEEGGPTTEANLVTACKKCNRRRGNQQYTAWLESPDYRRSSEGLSAEVRHQNTALVATLSQIPRAIYQRSR